MSGCFESSASMSSRFATAATVPTSTSLFAVVGSSVAVAADALARINALERLGEAQDKRPFGRGDERWRYRWPHPP